MAIDSHLGISYLPFTPNTSDRNSPEAQTEICRLTGVCESRYFFEALAEAQLPHYEMDDALMGTIARFGGHFFLQMGGGIAGGSLGSGIGGVIGFMVAGPAGAALGIWIGGATGNWVGTFTGEMGAQVLMGEKLQWGTAAGVATVSAFSAGAAGAVRLSEYGYLALTNPAVRAGKFISASGQDNFGRALLQRGLYHTATGAVVRASESIAGERNISDIFDPKAMAFDLIVGEAMHHGVRFVTGSSSTRKLLGAPTHVPELNIKKWIFVVNGSAGGFKAKVLAEEVRALMKAGGKNSDVEITIYQTHRDPRTRLEGIAQDIRTKYPSPQNPIGILAFGGDGTINNTLEGVFKYLSPQEKLLSQSAEAIAERMKNSGVLVGTVGMGSANDLAYLYGAPGYHPAEVLNYMAHATPGSLNLASLTLNGEHEFLVSHNACAGTGITPSFYETKDLRGYGAKSLRFFKIMKDSFVFLSSVKMRMADGSEIDITEVFFNASIMANRMTGGPTPQPGVGTLILPKMSRIEAFRFLMSVMKLGLNIKMGQLENLMPDKKIQGLNSNLQIPLAPGKTFTFTFIDSLGNKLEIPFQANGDYLMHASTAKVTALPAYPTFLQMPNSPMAKLAGLIEKSQQPQPAASAVGE